MATREEAMRARARAVQKRARANASPQDDSFFSKAFRAADDFVRSVAQGATFGFADEIAAAASSATGINDRGGFETNLAAERARDEQIPASISIPGQFAGGAATTLAAAPAAFIRSAGLGGNIGRGLLTGTLEGGLAGAGFAEGGSRERIEGATQGAIGGAAFGALTPLGVAGARGLARHGAQALGRGPTRARQKALRLASDALEEDQLPLQKAAGRLRRLGDQATVADVADENTRALVRAAASEPGIARNRINNVLNRRASGQAARLRAAVASSVSGQNKFETVSNALAGRAAKAKPLYDEALTAGIVQSDDIARMVEKNDLVRSAIRAAKRNDEALADLPDNHMIVLDRAFKRLSEQTRQARKALDSPQKSGAVAFEITEAKNRLRDAITKQVPKYGEALDAFSSESAMIEAVEEGSKFLSRTPDEIDDVISRLNPGEREMFLVGAADAITKQIDNAADRADAVKRIFGNPKRRDQIRKLIGDAGAFQQFRRAMVNESRFVRTQQFTQAGSNTAAKTRELQRFGEGGQVATDVARGGIFEGPFGAVAAGIASVFDTQRRVPPEVSQELASVLARPGVSRGQQVLDEIARERLIRELSNLATVTGTGGGIVATEGELAR